MLRKTVLTLMSKIKVKVLASIEEKIRKDIKELKIHAMLQASDCLQAKIGYLYSTGKKEDNRK